MITFDPLIVFVIHVLSFTMLDLNNLISREHTIMILVASLILWWIIGKVIKTVIDIRFLP